MRTAWMGGRWLRVLSRPLPALTATPAVLRPRPLAAAPDSPAWRVRPGLQGAGAVVAGRARAVTARD